MLADPEFAAFPGIGDIVVGSIDALQGQEARVVILVMTATSAVGPGFTANKARLNGREGTCRGDTSLMSAQRLNCGRLGHVSKKCGISA
ncbi:hypothetical protein CONLIGDRAFT_677996 [Coniochaeta ligniaria NRRL 30616]|uniref:DNA2/NAM7 helicase-like C-terminal domain-containing protein n=1 Tax=Coniochaeta ligniaria NRRL 30616 TaxID=1408157 RepID=A0A1J7JUV0_9PEZI|nr:hypothetical protein CONLIGDRAFT_677996 [Coniochaeta ligniaria NRRL 30616]